VAVHPVAYAAVEFRAIIQIKRAAVACLKKLITLMSKMACIFLVIRDVPREKPLFSEIFKRLN
jgi:hypothetical protein